MSNMFRQVVTDRMTKPTNMRERNTVAGIGDGFSRGKNITKRGERNILAYEALDHIDHRSM